MKNKLQKLPMQRIFFKAHNKTKLCQAFYCVNDNNDINPKSP